MIILNFQHLAYSQALKIKHKISQPPLCFNSKGEKVLFQNLNSKMGKITAGVAKKDVNGLCISVASYSRIKSYIKDANIDSNVTDIIIIIDHITQNNLIINNHELLLADIDSDDSINITDIILMIDSIIE